MRLADPTQLQSSANADTEFRLAARHWNVTLSLESLSGAFRVEIAGGEIVSCGEGVAGQPATITIGAPEDGWAEFLAPVPRPFFQDLLGGCVQHHGFTVKGDVLSLSAYYHASQRLFALIRALRTGTGGR